VSRVPVLSHERDMMIQLGASLLTYERARQIAQEGYSPQHDDTEVQGELARAAAAYALASASGKGWIPLDPSVIWPWAPADFKPRDARSNLVRAGALILAELERLAREDVPAKAASA